MPNLNLSFYNATLLFLTLTKAGRKKKYSVLLTAVFVFLETIVICLQTSLLSVKPSSFTLSPQHVFHLYALYLYITSWLRTLLKRGDSMSKRGPSSLPTGAVPP